jgi:hypothetical protein
MRVSGWLDSSSGLSTVRASIVSAPGGGAVALAAVGTSPPNQGQGTEPQLSPWASESFGDLRTLSHLVTIAEGETDVASSAEGGERGPGGREAGRCRRAGGRQVKEGGEQGEGASPAASSSLLSDALVL